MSEAALLALTALVSYLIGAVPFGYLVARWRGVDILKEGSGNIGATNVARVLGRRLGLLVFLLDFLKGVVPALAGVLLTRATRPDLPPDTLPVTASVAAFLGHLFPVFLRFRGGKGVATGAGAVTVLLPLPAVAALLMWLAVVSSTLTVSLASLTAAAVLCGLRFVTTPTPLAPENRVLSLFCVLAVVLVFARHHANIRRLLAGRENRLKDSHSMFGISKLLHVLAVGLWFGTAVFFTLMGFVVFGAFEREAVKKDRPAWFPVAEVFDQPRPSEKFPDPLLKEQGVRAAGFAVSPLFDYYYPLQIGCGAVAFITALGFARLGGKAQTIRVIVLLLAVLTVGAGWWLEQKTSELRVPRDEKTDELLRLLKESSKTANPASFEEAKAKALAEAEQARKTFGMWHGIAMLQNLATLALVTAAMGLTAFLPPRDTGMR